MNRLDKQSKEEHGMGWTSDKYKGEGFEAFIEVLIKNSPIDKRINIKNYRPHSVKKNGPDMGIDGYGISHDGNPHTVQIKFRSLVMEDLTTKDAISNFVATTAANPKYKDADMTIFTTAAGLNFKLADKMYHNRVRTIGYLASPPVIPSLGVLPRLVRPRFISDRLLEFYVSSVSQLLTDIKSAIIEVIHTSTCINSDVPRPIAVRPCDFNNIATITSIYYPGIP